MITFRTKKTLTRLHITTVLQEDPHWIINNKIARIVFIAAILYPLIALVLCFIMILTSLKSIVILFLDSLNITKKRIKCAQADININHINHSRLVSGGFSVWGHIIFLRFYHSKCNPLVANNPVWILLPYVCVLVV